jgi:predicted DNA-binding protein
MMTPKAPDMSRTTIWLTQSQCERLAALSQHSGTKQAELIRRALDQFLDEQSPAVKPPKRRTREIC